MSLNLKKKFLQPLSGSLRTYTQECNPCRKQSMHRSLISKKCLGLPPQTFLGSQKPEDSLKLNARTHQKFSSNLWTAADKVYVWEFFQKQIMYLTFQPPASLPCFANKSKKISSSKVGSFFGSKIKKSVLVPPNLRKPGDKPLAKVRNFGELGKQIPRISGSPFPPKWLFFLTIAQHEKHMKRQTSVDQKHLLHFPCYTPSLCSHGRFWEWCWLEVVANWYLLLVVIKDRHFQSSLSS